MGKELPLGIEGLVQKRLAWNQYLGDQNPISIRANELYRERVDHGASEVSTEKEKDSDWLQAEKEITQSYTNQLLPQLARV